MRRDYYLHKRNGVYYVEFIDQASGLKLSARSTGEKELVKAQIKAELWKLNGLPSGKEGKPRPLDVAATVDELIKTIRRIEMTHDDALRVVTTLKKMELIDVVAVKNTGRGAESFASFLEKFWDYDESEYIQDKLTHGHRFSRRYAYICRNWLAKHVKPFFGDKKLNCVTAADLKKLSNNLSKLGLATSTINAIMLVCCTPLRWAYNEKIIPADPSVGLTRFSVTCKRRDILTEAEAAKIFSIKWKDKRAYVASLVSATTGARMGECLALRKSDIGEQTLNLAYSFSYIDGLKCPKNGFKRVVPLLPEVKTALLDLLQDNPHDDTDPFILYSLQKWHPIDAGVILKGFKKALDEINIDRKGRNICFHSWRHFFCAKMTQKIEGEKVAKVSGHLSETIFKKYADHVEAKNIQEVGNVAAQVFSGIIPIKQGA